MTDASPNSADDAPRLRVEIPVAWGEMDSLGHVNNTIYLRWFESARIAYFEEVGVLERFKTEEIGPILARATIDFRKPVAHPDTVTVSARVVRTGNSSFVMAYTATSAAQGGALVAEGEGVIVMVHYPSGKSVALGALTEAMEAFEGRPLGAS